MLACFERSQVANALLVKPAVAGQAGDVPIIYLRIRPVSISQVECGAYHTAQS